jgi:hemophore-related protein
MRKWRSTKSAATVGGLALMMSLVPGVGAASAQPDLRPLIQTTCSYDQIVAALNAQAPDLAQELSSRPQAQTRLKQFLALPIDQRQQTVQRILAAHPQLQSMIDEKAGTSVGQQITQVANTCHNY